MAAQSVHYANLGRYLALHTINGSSEKSLNAK